ncbi:uncharacterized protein V6R79_005121 [Siganus canaliculatus]
MDDLDHSMHIAEDDWTSFYDESQECDLLQATLACLDNLSLSDSEDSGNSSPVLGIVQLEPQQSCSTSSREAENDAVGRCSEEGDFPVTAEEEGIGLNNPEGNIKQETNVGITVLQTEQLISAEEESTKRTQEDGGVQQEGGASCKHELEPEFCRQAEVSAHEQQTESASGVGGVRAEKERWFVTVCHSPVRQRRRGTSGKKKTRPKKTCKNGGKQRSREKGERKSCDEGLELETDNDSERESGTDCVTQANQKLGVYPSAEENPESIRSGHAPDFPQTFLKFNEEDNLGTIDRNKHDLSSSAFMLHDTFKEPSWPDSMESDLELGDAVEFLSTHSYDSESYVSAAESMEEPSRLVREMQHSESSLSLTNSLLSLTESSDPAQDTQIHCGRDTTDCEGYESTTVPSAASSMNKTPEDNSTCDADAHSGASCNPSDLPERLQQETHPSASGCSSGDQLSLPAVPDVPLTPCSEADSPETYAKAAGHAQPVYAISAFWDEMEKLTINDILLLRMGRNTSFRDTQETANTEEFPTNQSSTVSTVEDPLPDGSLLDTSDTADSDYFTQPDESKPDRSSCEFSTSDVEEEYWQFFGTSRNPSPDCQSKNQATTGDTPFVTHEEEESTSSEGRETPVPSEDLSRASFVDQNLDSLLELATQRPMARTKSVRNVRALNTEDFSLLCSDERRREESNSLGKLVPSGLLSDTDKLNGLTQPPFPEVFEYLLTEDKTNRDRDPEDPAAAPMMNNALYTFKDGMPFSYFRDSQCRYEKLIPIFSCSPPTVRELTLPDLDYVFLSEDGEGAMSQWTAGPHRFHSWKTLLSTRKICFHDKGSIWCRGSGTWLFPVEAEELISPITVLDERGVPSNPPQLCRQLAEQQRILEPVQTSKCELSNSQECNRKKHTFKARRCLF